MRNSVINGKSYTWPQLQNPSKDLERTTSHKIRVNQGREKKTLLANFDMGSTSVRR
jgi:hypothetical protein